MILLKVFLPLFFAFSNLESNEITCPQPTNLQVTSRAAGSITFDWDDEVGVTSYKLQFFRQADSYTSSVYSPGNSDFTFTNLQAGTYFFYFWIECGSEVSETIVIEDIVQG